VVSLFGEHPYIRLFQAEGNPPDRYVFEFHLESLVPTADDQIGIANVHRAEVFLPLDYPRRPPFCRMLSPVFHPNIDPQKICIGDHWSAGQSLAQLITRIGEMLCYQSYNVKSPLNAKAAAWAEENIARLPLQTVDLMTGL
jgi:ubiquitin-protein ligase